LIGTIPLQKWYSFQEKLLEFPVYYTVKTGIRGKLGTRATFAERIPLLYGYCSDHNAARFCLKLRRGSLAAVVEASTIVAVIFTFFFQFPVFFSSSAFGLFQAFKEQASPHSENGRKIARFGRKIARQIFPLV